MRSSSLRNFVAPLVPQNIQPIVGQTLDSTFNLISNSLRESCFANGWGEKTLLLQLLELSAEAQCNEHYAARDTLITPYIDFSITKQIIKEKDGVQLLMGRFKSPAHQFLPKESKECTFQMIIPNKKLENEKMPLVVQYAMTGDHGFSLRQEIGFSLIKHHNIASISICNPFYGSRKPEKQKRSALLNVTDIMCKGVALVAEGLSLFEYFKINKDLGDFGPFGVTGISMGGHMAALAGCNSLEPIAVIPCLSPYSAGPVFTEGLLRNWCAWKSLDEQLPSYLTEAQKQERMTSKQYLRYLLDETTDITKFPKPRSLETTIQVAAKYDGYVPGTGEVLYKYWEGSELRWTPYSHVSAIVLGKLEFVSAIADAFNRFPK